MGLIGGKSLQEPATIETIRHFVKSLNEVAENIKTARDDLKEIISSNEEIEKLDEEIKGLKEERKKIIENSPVISGYLDALDEAVEAKNQLMEDAKRDNIPRGEISVAINMLKKDLDIEISTDVYKNISDLVD